MIATLTLNPTIDGAAQAEVVKPMHKIRTFDEHYYPGGGGLNVARVINTDRRIRGKLQLVFVPDYNVTAMEIICTAADLSEASIEDLMINIRKAKNARGLRIDLKAMSLVIPTDSFFDAQRILTSDLQSGTANNDVNALKQMGAFPNGIISSPFITDTDAWFIKTDCPNGLMGFNRRAAEISQDNHFDTENLCIKGTERFVFGWGDWRGVFGSPGA